MTCERKDYLSYMLRLWRSGQAGVENRSIWRASVEIPQTRDRFVFASLAELFLFLEQEVDENEHCTLFGTGGESGEQ
jgi:hypothetical protein